MPHQVKVHLLRIKYAKRSRGLLRGIAGLALVASLFVLVSSEVRAENWFQVSADQRWTIEVDRDSVRSVGTAGLVELRWREKNSMSLRVTTGLADCARWVLHENETMVTDQVTKRTVRIPDEYDTYGPHFASFPGGPQLRAACEMAAPVFIQRLTERPASECDSSVDVLVVRQLCERDDLFRANYRLLWDRVFSLEDSCDEDRKALIDVLMEVALKAYKCKTDSCATDAVKDTQIFAARDLQNVYKWKRKYPATPTPRGTCRMMEVSRAEIARRKDDEAAKVGFGEYRQCVERSVAELDDRQSSAEIVARGLHGACSGEFNRAADLSSTFKSAESRATLYRQFEPKLIEVVLRHRAATKPKEK